MKGITSNKILAVEGKDEINFFCVLLNQLNIYDVQKEDIMGRNQFRPKLNALIKRPDFAHVRFLGIVKDADNDPSSAFTSICDILRDNNIKPPNKMNKFYIRKSSVSVGVFIMPGHSMSGMLEDLCTEIPMDSDIMNLAENYVAGVESIRSIGSRSKSTVLTYLAGMPDIVNSLGLGAKKGYWNLNSSKLKEVYSFLKSLK